MLEKEYKRIMEQKSASLLKRILMKEEVDCTNGLHYINDLWELSEDSVWEFQNKVNWVIICTYQQLSEDFIREFQSKVDWNSISRYQKLSREFIIEFLEQLNLDELLHNDNIERELKDEIEILNKI